MSDLTTTERATLLEPCACGHTINDHGSAFGCWTCGDDGGYCETTFETLLTERVGQIVGARVEGMGETSRRTPFEAPLSDSEPVGAARDVGEAKRQCKVPMFADNPRIFICVRDEGHEGKHSTYDINDTWADYDDSKPIEVTE